MTRREEEIFNAIRNELFDEIIPINYQDGKINHPMYGHCHHAALSMYILLGGKEKGYKLQKADDTDGIIHYWLINKDNEIIDPTKEQYTDLNRELPYNRTKNNRASYRQTKAVKHILNKINQA
ncbi:MAG: hypothetical protein RBR32_03445 [Bacteroidales bacterium]|nr:hypothetical protein [Bacteroidales bacterium]